MTREQQTISAMVDFDQIRGQFPILSSEVNGKPLVYLDNGASSQMPLEVADRLHQYHRQEHANIHRGVHSLSQKATDAFEATRTKVRDFISAGLREEIVFTTGTTDSINLVANCFGRLHFTSGDRILLSEMEHHANIVPWQMIAEQTGVTIDVIPITDDGELVMDRYRELLAPDVKMVAVTHVSNALGTVNPVREIVQLAHEAGSYVLIDGAQAVPHQPVNVQELDCDFYVFSAHKMCGPTGFGVLYGKQELLEQMPPYRGGGDMIDRVTFQKTTYNIVPYKFEAGTPPIAAGIGFGTAIDFLNRIGMDKIAEREHQIVQYAVEQMKEMNDITIVGNPNQRAAVISFLMDGVHPHDVGTILDKEGVAVRTGHHCAQPVMDRFGISATARASFSFYNNREDVDRFIRALHTVREFFS